MALQILSFSPIDDNMLAPTPNVTETEYILEVTKNDETPRITNVEGVRLKILTTHRGTVLYCAGGVTVFRVSPDTISGNGYYAMPSPGTEETVHFSTPNGRFRGQAIFLD
jgi:hypothetical protein